MWLLNLCWAKSWEAQWLISAYTLGEGWNEHIHKSLPLSCSSAERKQTNKTLKAPGSFLKWNNLQNMAKNPKNKTSSMFVLHKESFVLVSYHGTGDLTARTGVHELTGRKLVHFGLIAEVVFLLLINEIWTPVAYQFWNFCNSLPLFPPLFSSMSVFHQVIWLSLLFYLHRCFSFPYSVSLLWRPHPYLALFGLLSLSKYVK